MRTSDLSEYTGALRTSMGVRLTDRSPAATTELTLDFNVPCEPTEATADRPSLPVGLQLLAPAFQEERLFTIAARSEAMNPARGTRAAHAVGG